MSRRLALIGYGAIGHSVLRLLREHAPQTEVIAILERPGFGDALQGTGDGPRFVTSVDALLAAGPDLVIECAGHGALRDSGVRVLASGTDLLVASVGALADPEIERALREAARAGGACLRIPSGALGGFDVLAAARLAGLASVRYCSFKAPQAWRGTAADSMVDLASVKSITEFYVGDARGAAQLFPQNANVAAAVALAGIGFERTEVRLAVDPEATGNRHRIEASGAFGQIDISVLGRTLPDNPKTSQLAPMSLVRSVLALSQSFVIG